MVARVAAPKTRLGAPKQVPEGKFALGTRPTSVRGKNPNNAPKSLNTRDYGVKTPPATAMQPGNPIAPIKPVPYAPVAPTLTGI